MASAMASAASRSVPHPYTIPVGPRVRPPRLLPGTKADNTNPQPDEPPPTPGHVWVQGKWRDPGSNAARDRRDISSVQAEKALRHATHGMNIYAYSHIRTNQVVYSLSRVMQNNKVLQQLQFHGKQTVPSALRRDLWRPYFSIHFPQTPAGAEAGLQAYRRLRELAIQRQLNPPTDLITTTEADVQKAMAKYDPIEFMDKKKAGKLKNIPVKNQMLPKKLRGRKLMDQKASSVADAAAVLNLVNQNLSPAEALDVVLDRQSSKYQTWSSRALRRIDNIREKEAAKEAQIEARQRSIDSNEGQLGLTPHAARRIAIEHGGAIASPFKGMEYMVKNPEAIKQQQSATEECMASVAPVKTLLEGEQRPTEFDADKYKSRFVKSWKEQNNSAAEDLSPKDIDAAVDQERTRIEAQIADYDRRVEEAKAAKGPELQTRNDASRVVQILWSDLRDATWAEQWSSNVFHGELESKAAVKHEKYLARQGSTIDEDGNQVSNQLNKVVVQGSTSSHVFGMNKQSGWYQTPEEMTEQRQRWRNQVTAVWRDEKLEKSIEIIRSMDAIYQQKAELSTKLNAMQPEVNAVETETEAAVSFSPLNSKAKDVDDTPTDAAKYDARILVAKGKNSITKADQQLQEMEINYPTLYKKFLLLLEWRQGLDTYTEVSKLGDELKEMQSAVESEDTVALRRLRQIDQSLTSYAMNYQDLAELLSYNTNTISLEADLQTSTTQSRRKITQLEQQIATLESSTTTEDPASSETATRASLLHDARFALDNEHNLIATSRTETFSRRLNAIENTLSAINSNPEYKDTGVIDLLQQRVYAEQTGDSGAVETLTAELKERENDKLAALLGLQSKVEANVVEFEEGDRERGVEMPMPKSQSESKGIWGRVKSLFGR